MKLEFLPEGADNRPLIRLYGFDLVGARRLREAFRSLATGSVHVLALQEEWWVEPVEHCALELRTGPRDLGIVERAPSKFDCILASDGWAKVVELTNPFCEARDGESYQWLNCDGEISLLLSLNGTW